MTATGVRSPGLSARSIATEGGAEGMRSLSVPAKAREAAAGSRALLGILGGLGPLASAEFLKTLYEENPVDVEQHAPACVLLSDPTVPDRTEAILRGDEAPVARWLESKLGSMQQLGARRVVIACITMHHFLESVPAPLRELVVSLVDLTLEEVIASGGRWLLLTSQGTRLSGVFERSRCWRAAEPHVVWSSPSEQRELHDAIYRLKRHGEVAEAVALCERLVAAHGTDGFIAGCTELHLVTRNLLLRPPHARPRSLDPLQLVASRVSTLVDAPSSVVRAG
jgi:aspartate racemase